MFIHYDQTTNMVTGYTNFINPVPAVWDEPTIEIDTFDFINPVAEYQVQGGIPVHVGKTQEMLDAEKAERVKAVTDAVQAHMDAEAVSRGYDNALSACSYAGYPNTYEQEGKSFVAWRGAVWDYCYAELAKIEAGTRTEPTVDAFLLELPVFTLVA